MSHDAGERASDPLLPQLVFGPPTARHWLADGFLLLSRLYAGITIASAGLDKLPTPPWMVEQVKTIGFPFPEFWAAAACLTEFVAGLFLAAGLWTRPASLALAVTMGVASFGFHKLTPLVDMHIAQGYVWLFVVFLAVGPGRWSIDTLVRHWSWEPSQTGDGGPWRWGRSLLISGLISAPVLAWGLYREWAFEWQPPKESAEAETVKSVSLAGTFNAWALDANPMERDANGVWRTRIRVDVSGPIALKFAANGGWDLALGTKEGPSEPPATGKGDPKGGNIVIVIQEPGEYAVEIHESNYEYRFARTEASIDGP